MELEAFKAAVQTDPYTSLLTRMRVDAWIEGFEAARREVERGATADDLRRREGPDALDRAYEALSRAEARRAREQVAALAALAPLLPPDLLTGR